MFGQFRDGILRHRDKLKQLLEELQADNLSDLADIQNANTKVDDMETIVEIIMHKLMKWETFIQSNDCDKALETSNMNNFKSQDLDDVLQNVEVAVWKVRKQRSKTASETTGANFIASDGNLESDKRKKKYTLEELHILVITSVEKNVKLSQLLEEISDVGNVLKNAVKNRYELEIVKTSKAAIKHRMAELVIDSDNRFIKEARNGIELNSSFFKNITQRLEHNGIMLDDKRLSGWNNDFRRFYNFLENRFVDCGPEEIVKNLIVEWFEVGEMSVDFWQTWYDWFQKCMTESNDISLKSLRSVHWPPSSRKDVIKSRFLAALDEIKTNDFIDTSGLKEFLNLQLDEPSIEVEKVDKFGEITESETLNVKGRTVYLSIIKERLEAKAQQKTIKQVDFIVCGTLHIDCDLTGSAWQGKNIAVISRKVIVYGQRVFDVSGKSFVNSNVLMQAAFGKKGTSNEGGENGQDGRDGMAGESSGGIKIVTNDMVKPEQLTLILVGGDGENGESGGNGGDGADGKGISETEFDEIFVKYKSLYFDPWNQFKNYHPYGWKKKISHESNNRYIHYEFEDAQGRNLYYDYSAEKQKWYKHTVYDLIFLVKGANGTSGGLGGFNGKGGEGGNKGECVVINPESNLEYPVTKVQRNGIDGVDGEVGACGKPGNNGNDMAVVDRSGNRESKHWYGNKQPLRIYKSHHRDNGKHRRFSRYRKSCEQKSGCYVQFNTGELNSGNLQQQKRQKKEERSSDAQMKMKQAIVLNILMQKSEEYKTKMLSTVNANAVFMHAKKYETFKINDDAENEETEVQQEVTPLKEIDENESDSYAIIPPKHHFSSHQYLETMLEQQDELPNSQQVIDYFFVEFEKNDMTELLNKHPQFEHPDLLETILLAKSQDQAADGNLIQRENLAKCITEKCAKKIALTGYRNEVADFSIQCHNAQPSISLDVVKEENKLCHVKFVEPEKDKLWHSEVCRDEVKKLLDSFFEDYDLYKVDYSTLMMIEKIHERIVSTYSYDFSAFEPQENFWEKPKTWTKFKKSLTKSNQNVNKLMETVARDSKWFIEIFEPLRTKINQKPSADEFDESQFEETRQKLGIVPSFFEDETMNLDAAQYLIRFYYQMKTLLQFNRRLLVITLICHDEGKKECAPIERYTTLTTNELITMIEQAKIDTGSVSSEKHMMNMRFKSMAFRYLTAEMHNFYIELYGNEQFGTVELMESTGSPSNKLVQLYYNSDRFYDIICDKDLRVLLNARNLSSIPLSLPLCENYQRVKYLKWDYSTLTDKKAFASFFPAAFALSVFEWIDCYINAFSDQMILKMLHERFELDGNHLDIMDFQFLISSVMILQVKFGVSLKFIFHFASSIPQTKMVDEFVLLRIESQWRTQLKNAQEINKINATINNQFKILLVTKLGPEKIAENDLIKMFIMFRHTSFRNKELEKMSMDDMILASKRQQMMTLSSGVCELDNVKYYIIFLRRHNKFREASDLEAMLTKKDAFYIIPEKLIAEICMLITAGEINFDVQNFKRLLNHIKRTSEIPQTDKVKFITNEVQQRKIINAVVKTDEYTDIFSQKQRPLKTVAELIAGIEETEKEKAHRSDISWEMFKIIVNKSQKTVKLLTSIDACISQHCPGIKLRTSQKMAIIYAVESESNLLSQVNTGEGKSYIVAAIAIIRAKLQYKFVDIITSSPILAERDATELNYIYDCMNVEVDHNCHDDMDNRKTAYKAQVVYGDISRFQSDFLLHHFYGKNILGERDRGDSCVIVDEVDSMLLDNGNNMLYLSHSIHGMDLLEPLFVHIQRIIFLSDEKDDGVNAFATTNIKCQVLSDLLGRLPQKDVLKLTDDEKEKGNVSAVWSKLTRAQVIDNEGYLMIDTDAEFESRKEEITELLNEATTTNHAMKILVCLKAVVNRIREIEIPRYLIPFCRQHLTEYIENAKRAFFMKQNESYVVDTDHTVIDNGQAKKVTIIDRNTGVDLASSQWNGGLHQFIQIKHGCRISPLSMKAVFISNVNYLKGYKRINGLSGTLGSYEESKTLVKLYDAELIKIPTFKPKRFSEYVPVIADTEEKWLDALFEQIANQVKAMRSVLVICHSISKVETIQNGLELRYAALTNAEKIPLICYEKENLIVYKREHDKFEVAESDLQPGRLILATNLAGRGTDIKLCCDLRDAGGLHVIVSFLPENSRIEDQAYGRGGRCGDPGSGQIIALTNQTDAAGTPLTVFDLKLFRDNAEIQRLQSLTYNYEYHTQIEEDCLFKFKNCYAKALGQMDSKKSSTNIPTTNINQADDAKDIPTEAEIVYFALLDEWALWLDTQASAIKKCAQDRSDHQRTEIINSIDHFMDQHPIDTIELSGPFAVGCPHPHSLQVRSLSGPFAVGCPHPHSLQVRSLSGPFAVGCPHPHSLQVRSLSGPFAVGCPHPHSLQVRSLSGPFAVGCPHPHSLQVRSLSGPFAVGCPHPHSLQVRSLSGPFAVGCPHPHSLQVRSLSGPFAVGCPHPHSLQVRSLSGPFAVGCPHPHSLQVRSLSGPFAVGCPHPHSLQVRSLSGPFAVGCPHPHSLQVRSLSGPFAVGCPHPHSLQVRSLSGPFAVGCPHPHSLQVRSLSGPFAVGCPHPHSLQVRSLSGPFAVGCPHPHSLQVRSLSGPFAVGCPHPHSLQVTSTPRPGKTFSEAAEVEP